MLFGASSTLTDRAVVLKGGTVVVNGHLKELSIAGVGVLSDKKGAVGTRLEIIFEIPAMGYIQEIIVFGHIRRVHNADNGYYLALEFESISENQIAKIEDFLKYKERLKQLGKKQSFSK